MGSNQENVHTKNALIKVIDDEGSLRLKMCPRFDVVGGDRSLPEYDEAHASVETEMDWREVNMLISRLRIIRDRTFGKAE